MALNDIGREKKHVLAFRNYNPSLEDQFTKPAKSGRKPGPDVLINRLENKEKRSEKKVHIEDPNAKRTRSWKDARAIAEIK